MVANRLQQDGVVEDRKANIVASFKDIASAMYILASRNQPSTKRGPNDHQTWQSISGFDNETLL